MYFYNPRPDNKTVCAQERTILIKSYKDQIKGHESSHSTCSFIFPLAESIKHLLFINKIAEQYEKKSREKEFWRFNNANPIPKQQKKNRQARTS